MGKSKTGFLHPFIDYLIESKQLQIIIEEINEDVNIEETVELTDK